MGVTLTPQSGPWRVCIYSVLVEKDLGQWADSVSTKLEHRLDRLTPEYTLGHICSAEQMAVGSKTGQLDALRAANSWAFRKILVSKSAWMLFQHEKEKKYTRNWISHYIPTFIKRNICYVVGMAELRLGGGAFHLPRRSAWRRFALTTFCSQVSFSDPRRPPPLIMTQRAKEWWVELGLPGFGLLDCPSVSCLCEQDRGGSSLQRSHVFRWSSWRTRTPLTFAMMTTLHPSLSWPTFSQNMRVLLTSNHVVCMCVRSS